MPTHVAIQPGRLYPQLGYCVQVDKEGKWTATLNNLSVPTSIHVLGLNDNQVDDMFRKAAALEI